MSRWWFDSNSPRPLSLTVFPPLFRDAPWAFGVCVWYWGPICGWELNWHLFSALWQVVSFSISRLHCTVSLPWWAPRAALIYRCRDRHWEGGLSVYQKNHSRFLPGACELPSPGFWALIYSARLVFPPVEETWSSIRNAGNSPSIPSTITPVGLFYHNSHCHSSQGSQLGKTAVDGSPNTACMCFLVLCKLASREESFWLGHLISPCAVVKVCAEFNNRVPVGI